MSAIASLSRLSRFIRILRLQPTTTTTTTTTTEANVIGCGSSSVVPSTINRQQVVRCLSTDDDSRDLRPGKFKLPPVESDKPKKKKPLRSPEITLIMPDESVIVETLEDAEKIAKRRKIKLVRIVDFDTKTERPLYRLMSNLELFQEETKAKLAQKQENKNEKKNDDKLFIVSSKIGENDLNVKMNQMVKLIKKKLHVRVFISQDGNPARAEKVANIVEEELKEVAEKKNQIKKATTLKLHFVPKIVLSDENTMPSDDKKSKSNSKSVEKTSVKKNEKIAVVK